MSLIVAGWSVSEIKKQMDLRELRVIDVAKQLGIKKASIKDMLDGHGLDNEVLRAKITNWMLTLPEVKEKGVRGQVSGASKKRRAVTIDSEKPETRIEEKGNSIKDEGLRIEQGKEKDTNSATLPFTPKSSFAKKLFAKGGFVGKTDIPTMRGIPEIPEVPVDYKKSLDLVTPLLVDLGYSPNDISFNRLEVKPPLGIQPEIIWLEARIKELTEAIQRQLSTPGYTANYYKLYDWAEELHRRTAEVKEAAYSGGLTQKKIYEKVNQGERK